jgi:nucleoside-diphosphate-sugar epimerase
MTVLVTGATGVFGHRLVDRLADRGHRVLGLTRDDEGAAIVERHGGTPVRGDLLDRDSLTAALDGRNVDAAVHAATKLPPGDQTEDGYWARNDRVRLEGARSLVAVAGDRIDHVVFPSVVWVARQPDGSAFDEDAERHPDRATQSAADTEDFLTEARRDHGFTTAILRTGLFYGPDDHNTRSFAARLLSGEFRVVGGGVLGRRDATWSLLHLDDAADAFATAVDQRLDGRYHVVDEERVTVADYVGTLADHIDAPKPGRVPWWVARPFVGKAMVRFLGRSMPTTATRFREATGWEPTYPTYREGVRQVVDTWREDGTLAALKSGKSAGETVPDYRAATV